MKSKLTLLAFVLFLISACTDRQNVEVIPDYNEIYLANNNLDVPPQVLDKSANENEKFWDLLKSNFKANDKTVYYDFNATLYLSAAGSLEKIQFKKNTIKTEAKNAVTNPNFDELKTKLADYFAALHYTPGKLNGKDVNSQLTLTGIYIIEPDGTTRYISKDDQKSDYVFLDGDTYFVAVEEMPKIEGGVAELAKKIIYPKEAKEKGIEGRVFVKAYIDENGNVTFVQLIKSLGYGCDEVAMKAVKDTKFIPGKQRGKPVKTQVVLPISFKLQ